ncbi:MAG: glycoside hydrolase family 3 N-terminal domain-containing protein [bacterium]|nr:glycoside hydrolase family 3 N-terminal domain-containing protein [bacterium]
MSINSTVVTDARRSVEDRAALLLEQMTLDEKLAQIVGVWVTWLLSPTRQFEESKARQHVEHGVGHVARIAGASQLPPQESARLANRIQKFLREQTRLGIPAIVHEESCAGYLALGATTFPQAIGLASTWEPELIEQMTVVIRQQMRAAGAHHALGPVLDITRDARWGRMEETFGEDPFLTSALGMAYVRGIQGENLREGLAATGKHFLAHGMPEGGMNWAPAHVPERELREIFLTPFAAVIREGKIASMMNAYHELDGIPCGSSRELMVDLLRGEMGFEGVVAADYFTLKALVDYHRVARDKAEAARMGLEAGIDVELPARDCYGEPLKQALLEGRIPMELVDQSVRRVLRMKFELGLFENPYVDEGRVVEVFAAPEARELSRRLAQKSLVLLKNDGLLPLSKSAGKIALIGPHADSVRLLQGDYHYPSHLIHIFDQVTEMDAPNPQDRLVPVDWSAHFPPTVTVLEALKAAVATETRIHYARGCDVNDRDTSGFAEAVEAARQSEVAIVVLGDQSGLGKGSTVGESLDSATLMLPGIQQALLEAICATGTPVVLVLVTGRPYQLTWGEEQIPAILEAWLPAQEGGAAIIDALFGDINPGGKLTVTFPRAAGQVPVYYNHKPSGGRSNWHTNYVDQSTTPLFPFGHGLSYTRFTYSDLSLSHQQITPLETLTISLTVKNTGEYAGDEVVQLYIADPVASVTRPVKMLKGFKRIFLEPNQEKTITFQLDMRHFAFYDRQMQYVVEPGTVEVMVGSSSADIRLTGQLEIVGSTTSVEQVFFTPVEVT